MFNDSVAFNGGTRVEVIAVLANCGRDTDKARRALVTWIRHKQEKGRNTEHILVKLRDIESKFIKDTSLHSAFRDARAETFLPRAPDLPLHPSVRRNSERRMPGSIPTIVTSLPDTPGPSSITSQLSENLVDIAPHGTPQSSPPRLSRRSSQLSEVISDKLHTNRHTSLPAGVPHVPMSRSPRIQIPRNRSLQPTPDSPITSSPEEQGIHLRYRHMSSSVGPYSSFTGPVTPPSASPPDCTSSVPSAFRSRPHRNTSCSLMTSSSEESDFHPRYRYMAQPSGTLSPVFRRVTPPRTCPPDSPLPPIPPRGQDVDLDCVRSKNSPPAEQPSAPIQSVSLHSCTPVRPLPIQPVPSPIPGSDESEAIDAIGENSLRQHWQGSNGDLPPSDDIIRQDSPVYMVHNEHASQIGIGPPPPYVEQHCTYSPPDMPTIGDSLERAVAECGGSREVRLEVSRCIAFNRGYEPPYWHSRLQSCGLNSEAAKYLVDEMCKQVDWAASFGRS